MLNIVSGKISHNFIIIFLPYGLFVGPAAPE